MNEAGSLLVVPVIVEPCDWLHTPFLGIQSLASRWCKPISTWENANTAFLNVIQSLRKLLEITPKKGTDFSIISNQGPPSTRNYRIKKDFDSIEKL